MFYRQTCIQRSPPWPNLRIHERFNFENERTGEPFNSARQLLSTTLPSNHSECFLHVGCQRVLGWTKGAGAGRCVSRSTMFKTLFGMLPCFTNIAARQIVSGEFARKNGTSSKRMKQPPVFHPLQIFQIHFYPSRDYLKLLKIQHGPGGDKSLRLRYLYGSSQATSYSRSGPIYYRSHGYSHPCRFCELRILGSSSFSNPTIPLLKLRQPPDTFDRMGLSSGTLVLGHITRSISIVLSFYDGAFELNCYKAAGATPFGSNWINSSDLLAWKFLQRGLEGKTQIKPLSIYSESCTSSLAKTIPNRRFYLTPPFSCQHTWICQEYPQRRGHWHAKSESNA